MSMLEGRTVLITGASRGIGKEIALRMADQKAKLILVSDSKGDLDQLMKECGGGKGKCDCHCVDLSQPQEIDNFCKEVLEKHSGGVDVLVNNAGVFGGEQDPLKGNPDEWDKMIAINLKAPMRLAHHLAPKMCDKSHGWIINIGDVEATHTGPHHPAYAASKHGMRGWAQGCYELLRDKGVKVATIHPGNVHKTAMAEETGKRGEQGVMDPRDVAEAVMFMFKVSENCVPQEIIMKAAKPTREA